MTALKDFNPVSRENVENPFPFYKALREEAPVHEISGLGVFVSRYADILQVLNNEEVFSSKLAPGLDKPPTQEQLEIMSKAYPPVNTLVTNDPPSHTRFRSLVNKAFSARRVAGLEPSVRSVANQFIDRFIGRGRVELVSEFAVGLPMTIIADALGVPRGDLEQFKLWSDAIVEPLGGMISYERRLECARGVVEFQHYFVGKLDERRRSTRDDLLSDLVNARLEGLEPLTTAELLSIIQQLLVAGNETTTNLIGNAMLLLLRYPASMQALVGDPSLIPNFVEEALRFESPVQTLSRITTRDCELGGVKIAASARVFVVFASANRDDVQFADAAKFDVARANARSHLGFGQGIHFCIGAALARLEARVAFELLLSRLKNIRLAAEGNELTHTPSFILRGLRSLYLEFDPA